MTDYPPETPRVTMCVRVHPRLRELARARAKEHGLRLRQVVEWALAELLAVPLAVEGVEMELALCASCERGLVTDGRCAACGWRPVDRRESLAYSKQVERAFWAKVDKDGPVPEGRPELGPCWIWTAALNSEGYGVFRAYERNRYAHILSWEKEHGRLPPGRELDHLCRTPRCVRPSHLEAVTHAINVRRGNAAKLSETAAAEIRASSAPARELARIYGVDSSQIYRVRSGERWREARARENVEAAEKRRQNAQTQTEGGSYGRADGRRDT